MNNDYVSNRLNNYFNDLLHKYPETPPTSKFYTDLVNKNYWFIIIIIITIIFFIYKYFYKDFEYKHDKKYKNNKIEKQKQQKKIKKMEQLYKKKIKYENEKTIREKEELLSIIDELNSSIDNSSYVKEMTPPVVIKEHTPYNQVPHNQPHGSNQFSAINNNTDSFGDYNIMPPYSQ
jgi:hypothetical protein